MATGTIMMFDERGKREEVTQMAWESRNGRGRYYTRSRKVNGRVVREYLGTSPHAELMAAIDAGRREVRQAKAAAERLERENWGAMDAEVKTLCALAEALAARSLEAAGYHRHKRGEWRRRRGL